MGDRLLLVEDDRTLGAGLCEGLLLDGYEVEWVRDGLAAERCLQSERFTCVILDLGLPALCGLEVLAALRGRGDSTPVLVLTARSAVRERIVTLDAGADDYLVKPISLEELAARLRAVCRRASGGALPLRHRDIVLDPAAHCITRGSEKVNVSPHQFKILHLLLRNSGRVMSRNDLEKALYGWNTDVESNTIEVHIHSLRKKFGENLIRTVRGIGYMVDESCGT